MQKDDKREEFVIRVGPLLKGVLDKQTEIIKDTTWECVNASDYESGEIIAKKIIENRLV